MRRHAVLLTSGLGNQLFQLAFAHYLAQGSTIQLLSVGAERRAHPGQADLAGFDLAPSVDVRYVLSGTRQRLLRKVLGRHQVLAAERERSLRRLAFVCAAGAMTRLCLPEIGFWGGARTARGYGLDGRITPASAGRLSLGYFQSWLYSNPFEIAQLLGGPRPSEPSAWFDELLQKAREEKPVVVHVRLGDYREQAGWTVASDYYSKSLESLHAETSLRKVWLFSDEPDAAVDMLKAPLERFDAEVVEPPDQSLDPAAVLSAMTLGAAFVLANSTFSYWAARMSGAPAERIFVPDPWFTEGPDLPSLVPPEWRRMPRLGDVKAS